MVLGLLERRGIQWLIGRWDRVAWEAMVFKKGIGVQEDTHVACDAMDLYDRTMDDDDHISCMQWSFYVF